jgi:hypothetical protein
VRTLETSSDGDRGRDRSPSEAPERHADARAERSPASTLARVPLGGRAEPISGHGPLAIVEALLKAPASIVHELRHGRGVLAKLAALVVATMILTGVAMATFSGGLQVLFVPLKLAVGIFFCAIICLPSLHVLSCLSGAEQSVRETWGVRSPR